MNKLVGSVLPLSLLLLAGCRSHPQYALSPVPPPELDALVDQQARAASPQSEKMGDLLRGAAISDDGHQDWTVLLDAQHCYFFSGVGEQTVARMALYLWNPSGHRVADKHTVSPLALLNYCPTETGAFRLEGKAAHGHGHFAVGIYRVDAAPAPQAAPPPPPADLAQAIYAQAQSAAPGAVQVGALFEGNADKTDWSVALDPAHCYWFIGAGEPGKIKELYLYLWDPQNKRVTETKSVSNTVMVGHCPVQNGMFRFQAKIDSGRGLYKVGVFSKPR